MEVIEKVETAVEGEAKQIEGEVVAEAKAALVQIAAEEKLVLRETELEFLKVQMELQRLSKLAEEKSKSYTAFVEGLYTRYGLNKAEYLFDAAVNQFKKL